MGLAAVAVPTAVAAAAAVSLAAVVVLYPVAAGCGVAGTVQ